MQAVRSLLTLLLLATAFWFFGREMLTHQVNDSLPIRYVRTEGVFQYLSKDEVKAVLLPLVSGSIFEADMQKIHAAVAELPWVKSVSVERVWPDAVDIKVTERKAYVRWGDKSLLTENGELFTPKNVEPFQSLLLVNGPKDQEAKTLEIMKGVRTALDDKALEMAEFSVNDRQAWRIKLKSELEIVLGRTDQLKKLQRFLSSLSLLGQERVAAMQVVDLRYPNGFAVSWRPGSEAVLETLKPKTEQKN